MNRRRFLTSLAAVAGLALIPKRVKADVKPVKRFADYCGELYIGPGVSEYLRPHGFTKEEWMEVCRLNKDGYKGRLKWHEGRWRMGLISNDNEPAGTSIYDWQVVTDKGEHLGRVYGSANDLDQSVCVCSDTCRDGRRAVVGMMYPAPAWHFAYTGPHPIYSRLFPMPTPVSS